MGVAPKRLRHQPVELGLDDLDGLAGSEAGAVADSEGVRIHRERFFAKGSVEHDIGGLAADPGKRLQRLARARDFAVVLIDERLAEQDDILRLGVEQPDRLDRLAKLLLAEFDHLFRRSDPREQRAAGDVYTDVGGLRGQNDGDQQLVRVTELQLSRGRGIGLGQPPKEFEYLVTLHLRSSRAWPSLLRASSKSSVGRPKPMRK